jgi:pyrimidine deaminase RibD-like protein
MSLLERCVFSADPATAPGWGRHAMHVAPNLQVVAAATRRATGEPHANIFAATPNMGSEVKDKLFFSFVEPLVTLGISAR